MRTWRWVVAVAGVVAVLAIGGRARADEPVVDHSLYLPHLVFQPVPHALAQPDPDDGGTWTAMNIVSLTDGWLGTSNGSIYRLVNEQPQRAAQLSAARINDISVAADGSVWAVTEAGEVLRGGASGWRVQATLPPPLSAVSAVSATDVWVIRDSGLRHWDGASWGEVSEHPPFPVSRVVAVSATEVWVVSNNSVLRWGGVAWSLLKHFDPMRVDDLVVWPDGQVRVVGSDPSFPSDDPRVAPGAHLLHVWDGVQWATTVLSRGYVTYSAPSMVNRVSGVLCLIVTGEPTQHSVRCLSPVRHFAAIDRQFYWPPSPLALFMITPYDGWALTAVLYRVHIPAP